MDPASKAGVGGDKSSHLPSVRPEDLQKTELDSGENNSSLPWQLTLHFSDWPDQDLVRLDKDGLVMHDAFINSVKEADFLRNGTAKGIMSLSKEDSSGLWNAVEKGKYIQCISLYP